MELIAPSRERLPLYIEALERYLAHGEVNEWNQAQLAEAKSDPERFLASAEDPEGVGTLTLGDGSVVPRLPGFARWMWDGEIAGAINFRWIKGTTDLPPTCLGHIGYETFPWKRGLGYATSALAQMLIEIAPLGLPYVELTTNPENLASQKVIQRNGGSFVKEFTKHQAHGGGPSFLYRIALNA